MFLVLLLASFIGDDVTRLGSDDWNQREAAHERLRSYGLLAVPALQDGAKANKPEVRRRCLELLGRWERYTLHFEAARVLTAPQMPNELAFWSNERLKLHVFKMALGAGCSCVEVALGGGGPLPPVMEMPPEELSIHLLSFRAQLATHSSGVCEPIARKMK